MYIASPLLVSNLLRLRFRLMLTFPPQVPGIYFGAQEAELEFVRVVGKRHIKCGRLLKCVFIAATGISTCAM